MGNERSVYSWLFCGHSATSSSNELASIGSTSPHRGRWCLQVTWSNSGPLFPMMYRCKHDPEMGFRQTTHHIRLCQYVVANNGKRICYVIASWCCIVATAFSVSSTDHYYFLFLMLTCKVGNIDNL